MKSSNLVLRMINTRLILPVEADRIISGLSLEPVCFSEQFFFLFFFFKEIIHDGTEISWNTPEEGLR